MHRVTSAFFVVSMLGACSKPLDTVIPVDKSTWNKSVLPEVRKLPPDDQRALTNFLIRVESGEVYGDSDMPAGITLKQALASQKKWEAANLRLEQQRAQERAAAIETLNKAVAVTLRDKQQVPADWHEHEFRDYQFFRIDVENTSGKRILGVAGALKFIDIFDKELGSVSFRISEEIYPGQIITWQGSRDYNRFIPEHRAVWLAEKGTYRTKFIPEAVVFADGTKVVMP